MLPEMRGFRVIALIGAPVHVRARSPWAVTIKGDAIVADGTNREIRSLPSSSTKVIDLKGETVVPGLMDNHLYPYVGRTFRSAMSEK